MQNTEQNTANVKCEGLQFESQMQCLWDPKGSKSMKEKTDITHSYIHSVFGSKSATKIACVTPAINVNTKGLLWFLVLLYFQSMFTCRNHNCLIV